MRDASTSLVDKNSVYELCFMIILSYAIITNGGNSLLVRIMETVKSYNKQIFVFLKNNSFTRMSVSNFNTSAERNTSVRELFFFYIVRKYIQNCHLMAA